MHVPPPPSLELDLGSPQPTNTYSCVQIRSFKYDWGLVELALSRDKLTQNRKGFALHPARWRAFYSAALLLVRAKTPGRGDK